MDQNDLAHAPQYWYCDALNKQYEQDLLCEHQMCTAFCFANAYGLQASYTLDVWCTSNAPAAHVGPHLVCGLGCFCFWVSAPLRHAWHP
jgi:hypothetical protein